MSYRRHILRYGLMAMFGALGRDALAAQTGKPQWLKLEWGEVYLQTETQYERERQSGGSSTTGATTYTQTIVDPAAGFGVDGSLYHPNLVQFHLNTELGLDYEDTEYNPGGSSSSGKFLQRYHGSMDVLSQRPYATTFFVDKDMTYRDYDFFSRVRVDSEQYGGRTGYSAGPVPFDVSVQHFDENDENPSRPMNFWQNTVALNAQNIRAASGGSTRLNYNVNNFSRQDDGFNTTQGVSQNLNVNDSEQFGARKQAQLNSLLSYSALTQTEQPTSQLLTQENLRWIHTPKLESYYTFLFNTSSVGDSDANTYNGRSGVSYQLRPDLTTGLDGQGQITRSDSPGSSLETKDYGPEASAQYTPTLSDQTRLTVSDNVLWNHEDRDATGLTQNIVNETHTLTAGSVTLLSQPNVDTNSIAVYADQTHTKEYVSGQDYLIIPQGAYTQIQGLVGGNSTLPNPAVVFVDYTAAQQGSSAYDTLANNAAFRFDFWNGLLGLYGRWAVQNYSGGANLQLRTLNDKTIGVDSTWRWFRAGAEYQAVDSNLTPYNRTRFFQSAHFQPGEKTDLSLNGDEGWTDFIDTNVRQTTYGFIARLQQRLTSRMSAGAEGGLRIERGDTFNQNLATSRFWLDWARGKMTVKLSYEYNYESQSSADQDRHYLFVRVRRDFK